MARSTSLRTRPTSRSETASSAATRRRSPPAAPPPAHPPVPPRLRVERQPRPLRRLRRIRPVVAVRGAPALQPPLRGLARQLVLPRLGPVGGEPGQAARGADQRLTIAPVDLEEAEEGEVRVAHAVERRPGADDPPARAARAEAPARPGRRGPD